MAEKRMVSKSISISEKVNMLPDIFDMLLFTWLIPHTDDFGRLHGSPAKVKALVVPMLDKSIKDIERTLTTLHNEELIQWYEVDGNKYIQVVNFEKHQTGLHKRTSSKFPEAPTSSGKFPEIPPQGKGTELKGTEENRTEEKGTEGNGREMPAPDSNPHKDYIHQLVNQCQIKNYTLHDLDVLFSYIGMVDIEVIEAAIKKGYGKDHINYAIKTLRGMIQEGKTKKEHVFEKPTPGQAPANVAHFPNRTKTGKVTGMVQEMPKGPELSAEELAELNRLAERMDRGEIGNAKDANATA